jgi:hypothetical protein
MRIPSGEYWRLIGRRLRFAPTLAQISSSRIDRHDDHLQAPVHTMRG